MVYLGSLLLVIGIFSMFYVRERRLWFWLKDSGQGGASVLMAMSTARRTLDFEREFERTRASVAAALGVSPLDPAASPLEPAASNAHAAPQSQSEAASSEVSSR